jgi:ABC-2 type transport system ATP-binding protein
MGQQPIIELHGITRTFGSFTALKDVTLSIPPGQTGLLGPNGAGKSTLLKILMGLISPSSGTGRVLDQPIGANRDANQDWQLRRQIGFMPEADALVPGLSGLEYVTLAAELCGLPRRQAQRRSHEVLGYLGLDEARYRKVEEYSLGMRQRVKLAQAVVHDPPVLLLDEPTSGLDPAGRDSMLKLVAELARDHGKSVLLCTHLLADVQNSCQQVVILSNGQVRRQGSIDELRDRRADRFKLRIQGNVTRFREELQAEGVQVLSENGQGELQVQVPPGWSNVGFFKLASLNEVIIRALLRDDESLEELFFRTVTPPAA